MGAVAKEAIEDLDIQINDSKAKVTVSALPTVHANQTQMVQLITNLVGNALKYAGKDAPVIDIAAKKAGTLWVFSVRDNGIWIDPKDANRIFELYQRVDTAGKPGTGIGLTICKRIVENYGGRIWVESELGKGSTFYFTLPAK
jgi:signal transduction histidine kinase